MAAKKKEVAKKQPVDYKLGREIDNINGGAILIKVDIIVPIYMLEEATDVIRQTGNDICEGKVEVVSVNLLDQSQDEAEKILLLKRWNK